MDTHTCGVCGLEALPLYRGVRNEAEVHLVACGDQLLRDLAATQSAQDGCCVAVPIKGLQMVICTFLVLLNLELVEGLERRGQREREGEKWLSATRVGVERLTNSPR